MEGLMKGVKPVGKERHGFWPDAAKDGAMRRAAEMAGAIPGVLRGGRAR
jgi:hypothetical protein